MIISQFLKDNFYYISQKYLIYRIIKDILEDLLEKLGQKIIEKMNNFISSEEINSKYKNIYLKIFEDFGKEINKYRIDGKIY